MASNEFQKDYITYLENKNAELVKKLTVMRENYENKVFSKNMKEEYLLSILEELLNVSSALPREIDSFFEKMAVAMKFMENVLLKKAELVQKIRRVSSLICHNNSDTECNSDMQHSTDEPNFQKEINVGSRYQRKGIRVSPMIDGHVILTGPKVCIPRLEECMIPIKRNSDPSLSPILEVSPETTNIENSEIERHTLKEIKIPLERIDIDNESYVVNKESPKCKHKRSERVKETSTPKSPLEEKKEKSKNEPVVEKEKVKDNALEGCSWMYSENDLPTVSPFKRTSWFVDSRKRRHRFATLLYNDEELGFKEIQSEKQEPWTPKKSSTSKTRSSKSAVKTEQNSTTNSRSRSSEKYDGETNKSSLDFIEESLNNPEGNENSWKKSKLSGVRVCEDEFMVDFKNFEKNVEENSSTPLNKFVPKPSLDGEDKSVQSYEADVEENPPAEKNVTKLYRKRSSLEYNNEASFEESPKSKKYYKTSKQTVTSQKNSPETRLGRASKRAVLKKNLKEPSIKRKLRRG